MFPYIEKKRKVDDYGEVLDVGMWVRRGKILEENDNDEVHLRTKFLFDEDKAMTPLSQMQATKDMLTEAQRIAYVGLCACIMKEMASGYRNIKHKDVKFMLESLQLWSLKIMGRLYYHMELETQGEWTALMH